MVRAANSPESWATINQRGALGSLGARHLLWRSLVQHLEPAPKLNQRATRSARFGCCATRGGVANKKFYRPASGRAKNYRRYLFPVRSRAKATACNVARIINSAIPPLLFLTSVNGSTTFYLFRDACGEYCNATCVRSYRPVCIGIERYVPFSDVHPISHHDLMHGFVAPVIHRSSFAGNGIDRTDHL